MPDVRHLVHAAPETRPDATIAKRIERSDDGSSSVSDRIGKEIVIVESGDVFCLPSFCVACDTECVEKWL